ncbi:MAG: DUF3592 domain-containing protein [Polyangiaceae bacterium]
MLLTTEGDTVDAIDHFSSLPWESPFAWVGIALMSLAVALVLLLALRGWLARIRPPRLQGELDALDGKSWAGWRVDISGDGKTLTVTCPEPVPEGLSFTLDTKAGEVEQASTIRTGVPFVDFVFEAQEGSAAVGDCLAANRALVERQVPFLRGWIGRIDRIQVSEGKVCVVLRKARHGQLREVLPAVVAFGSAIHSAAWWYPPPAHAEDEQALYRGRVDVAPDAASWRIEVPGLAPTFGEPVSLLVMIRLLREGRLTWLSRVERLGQGIATLASIQALSGSRVLASDAIGADAAVDARPKRVRWSLYRLAQWFGAVPLCFAIGAVGCECSRPMEDVRLGRASESWPSVEGVVIESQITSRRMDEGGDKHKPVVAYRYAVDGKSYVGRRLHFHYNWSFEGHYPDRGEAEALLAPYPVGAKPRVFFDPKAPEESTLQPGVDGIEYVKAGLGLLLVAVFTTLLGGVWLARISAWRARLRSRDPHA